MPTPYTRLQILLHWMVVLGIGAALLLSEQMHDWEDMPAGAGVPWHGVVGLAVLGLMLARIVLRLTRGAPPPPEGTPAWQHRIAELTHRALYGLVITTPLAGASAFYLRLDEADDVHEALVTLLLATAALHAIAALFNHVVRQDGTLARMWFRRN